MLLYQPLAGIWLTVTYQVSELVHVQRVAESVGVRVVVVNESLVGAPDDESLQLFHERYVRSPVHPFPRLPL